MERTLRIGTGPQVFFDNYIIEDWSGLQRKFQGFQMAEKPFFTREKPWEEPCGPVDGVLLHGEDGIYRLWYEVPFETAGTPGDERILHSDSGEQLFADKKNRHRYEYVCYAESEDGIHWIRPALDIYPEFGAGNNVVLKGPECRTNGLTIIYNPEDGNQRYTTLFQGPKSVFLSCSEDGKHWSEPEEVIKYYNDTGIGILKKPDGGWRLYGRNSVYAGNWQRRIAVYDSPDLRHWDKPANIMIPENTNDEYYGLKPYRYGDFYIGLLMWLYSTQSSTLDCEWVFSRDGINWKRTGCKALSIGEIGRFDAYRSVYGQYLEVDGDTIKTLYAGCQARHNAPLEQKDFSLAIATMRRDGFCWLDSCDANFTEQRVLTAKYEDHADVRPEGHLLTRPFIFEGNRLEINCDATGGYIQAGILDMETEPRRFYEPDDVQKSEQQCFSVEYLKTRRFIEGAHEEPFPGFSVHDCDAFHGDSTAYRMTWNGKEDLSALRGKTVRLQIHMSGCKLYSFTIRQEEINHGQEGSC